MQTVDEDRSLLGIAFVLIGMASISVQDMLIKLLSDAYPLHQIVFTRSAVAILLTLILIQFEGGMSLLKTRRPGMHLLRGALLVFANMAYFTALAAMPLAEASALFFIAPLFITILAIPVLGETIGKVRWFAVLIGLAGAIVMLRPGREFGGWVTVMPILAAFAYAAMQMITRKLGVTDRASVMAIYVQCVFLLVSTGMGLAFGSGWMDTHDDVSLSFLLRAWKWPDADDAVLLAGCGVMTAIVGYSLSQAYRVAQASTVAPFEYSELPMAMFWGLVVFGHFPDLTAQLGISLILLSGIIIFIREGHQQRALAARRAPGRHW